VRALGVTVPQRRMLHLLQTRTATQLAGRAVEAMPVVPSRPLIPQLTPLHQAGRLPSAVTVAAASDAPVAASTRMPAPVPEGPPGYLGKAQFAALLAAVQESFGLPFTTIATSVYRNLEATHRGYVDSASLTTAARTGNCGPGMAGKMPMFFSACDEIGIGKISTTQVSTLLLHGAVVLSNAGASE